MFAPPWVSCLLFTTHSKNVNSYLSTCHFSFFEFGMNQIGFKAGGLGSSSKNRSLRVIRLWGEGWAMNFVSFCHKPQQNGNNDLSACLLFSFESGMDQIGLEAGRLGSCSRNRFLGVIRLWRRAPPWMLCLFFSQATAKKETNTSPVFFFLYFPRKADLPIPQKVELPFHMSSPTSPSTKIYRFCEPTGNPKTVSLNVPLLTVGFPCIQAYMESNNSLMEHTSVDCHIRIYFSFWAHLCRLLISAHP